MSLSLLVYYDKVYKRNKKGTDCSMKVHEKLLKPLIETKYLTVDNTDRYRCIVRLFYLNYEKLKYWMYQEEVYEELREDAYFAEYTPEQCQQDLTMLVNWKNLVTIQDTKKVSSIEEFKNKKFRYQLSEYTVEIERMVIRLENLFIEGASLESTLLERIKNSISEITSISQESDERLYGWWSDLNNDFVRLNQNYQDYMRELNSMKAEEMMKTKEFLLFKDRLIEYLRSFVKSLQMNASAIEVYLKEIEESFTNLILERITEYEWSIPRLEMDVEKEQIAEKIRGRWKSILEWFIGKNGGDSEVGKVFDTTNEIIRKITRYAARISERSNSGANRKEEYYKLAVMFSKCNDIQEAHCLAASIFGIERPLHLNGDFKRKTESINSGVWEEDPCNIIVTPRVRTYREKTKRTAIVEYSLEKEETRNKTIQQLQEQRMLLQSYIQGQRLEFDSLPVIEPHVRDVFLLWLSKALENKEHRAKTEDGLEYYVEEKGKTCVLNCTDGTLQMPAYTLVFL